MNRCKVCDHPQRVEIERAIATASVRDIARRFNGLRPAGVHRHKVAHMGKALSEADRAKALSALSQAEWMVKELRSMAEECRPVGRQFVEVMRAFVPAVVALARITGEIREGGVTIINQLGVSLEVAQKAVNLYQSEPDDAAVLEAALSYLSQRLGQEPDLRGLLLQRLRLGEEET